MLNGKSTRRHEHMFMMRTACLLSEFILPFLMQEDYILVSAKHSRGLVNLKNYPQL